RTGQSYPAGARTYVVQMLALDLPDLPTQVVPQRRGQDRDAAVAALAAAHRDLPAIEVDVLDAELQRLEQAQARAVQQACDESVCPLQLGQDGRDVPGRGYHGQSLRCCRTRDAAGQLDREAQDLAVKELDRACRLPLRRCADVATGEVRQECFDRPGIERCGMSLPVVQHEAPDPRDVRRFRARAELSRADRQPYLREQPRPARVADLLLVLLAPALAGMPARLTGLASSRNASIVCLHTPPALRSASQVDPAAGRSNAKARRRKGVMGGAHTLAPSVTRPPRAVIVRE